MNGKLKNKVAIITGAGSGIGKAVAEVFATANAQLTVTDIETKAVDETASNLKIHHSSVLSLTGDVTNQDDVKYIIKETIQRFEKIDILINCAGVTPRYAPKDWNFEQTWDWVMNVNLKGTYLMSRFTTQHMQKRKMGSVVNMSSIYGLVGRPSFFGTGHDPYPPSKGAIITLTKDMANALGSHGIRINALCPGFIYTPLTKTLTEEQEWLKKMLSMEPLGRLGYPEEVAKAALFFASDDASFITGTSLPVDGGYTSQ